MRTNAVLQNKMINTVGLTWRMQKVQIRGCAKERSPGTRERRS